MTFHRVAAGLVFAVLIAFSPRVDAVEVERVVSKGGIEAWLVRDHVNPITTVKLSFKGGGALDPKDKAGLATLVSATIDEGAGELDSTAFQKALDDKSITLRFEAGLDKVQGTLRTLNKYRDDAFEYLRLALTEARFDDEPVERLRAQLVSRIEQQKERPSYKASRSLFDMAYPGHPYARPSGGTVEGIKAVTKDDLRTFVRERFAKDNLIIGVVGDITADALKVYLDKVFAALPENASPVKVAAIDPLLKGGTQIIDVDVPQSSIQFAQPGILREDPDFYTAYVLNYILGGGGFVSRLYDEVREKRGLAYSVYSYLMPLDYSATVMGGAGTANERVQETITTVKDVWSKFASDGPTEKELADAKTYLTGAFPLRFTSSGTIAGMLVGMQEDELGIDYIDKRNSYIEAVTIEDAKRVAAKLFQPENLSFVIAGKPEGVKAN